MENISASFLLWSIIPVVSAALVALVCYFRKVPLWKSVAWFFLNMIFWPLFLPLFFVLNRKSNDIIRVNQENYIQYPGLTRLGVWVPLGLMFVELLLFAVTNNWVFLLWIMFVGVASLVLGLIGAVVNGGGKYVFSVLSLNGCLLLLLFIILDMVVYLTQGPVL